MAARTEYKVTENGIEFMCISDRDVVITKGIYKRDDKAKAVLAELFGSDIKDVYLQEKTPIQKATVIKQEDIIKYYSGRLLAFHWALPASMICLMENGKYVLIVSKDLLITPIQTVDAFSEVKESKVNQKVLFSELEDN